MCHSRAGAITIALTEGRLRPPNHVRLSSCRESWTPSAHSPSFSTQAELERPASVVLQSQEWDFRTVVAVMHSTSLVDDLSNFRAPSNASRFMQRWDRGSVAQSAAAVPRRSCSRIPTPVTPADKWPPLNLRATLPKTVD